VLLEFAHRLTVAPAEVVDADRAALRAAGWSERDIWRCGQRLTDSSITATASRLPSK